MRSSSWGCARSGASATRSSSPSARPDNGSADAETDIRFLDLTELEQLVGAPYPSDAWGSIEPTFYLTAAMTGMRQGELLALRWRDVDFEARRVRVVKNYVRGQFDTPKSRKSARSVPMASRVDQALLELKAQTDFAGKDDLVFCHPYAGNPLDRSELIRRFRQALDRAQVHEITFHELRHTFGTTMAAAGVPTRMIQEWMGQRTSRPRTSTRTTGRARTSPARSTGHSRDAEPVWPNLVRWLPEAAAGRERGRPDGEILAMWNAI